MKYGVYHGCHNSFVICDYMDCDLSNLAKIYCEKHHTDGFIAVKRLSNSECSLEMYFYNQDGSRAPMCGNGIRCMVRYAYDNAYIKSNEIIKILTLSGIREIIITSVDPFIVKVNLGKPNFNPIQLSIDSDKEYINEIFPVTKDKNINLTAIYLGTHHSVTIVNSIEEANELGSLVCHHPFFKVGVNANFVIIQNRKNIFVKTFERGVGWTLACGTGASSSFTVLNMLDLVDDEVTAHFIDGKIKVSINKDKDILMEGPAEKQEFYY